jgi:DNA-binding response OmpR family regulator
MDRVNRNVRRNGHEIELTVKEFALLEFLMLRRGESCSRAELLREVWQMAAETPTNIVDVYVNYLRKKLGAAHGDGETCAVAIKTVRGTGYRLSSDAVKHVVVA